jgi:hypothetical protein
MYLNTGQITCHDVNGETIACTGSGQDAESHKGLAWPVPRFEHDNNVVTDRLTGLIWTRDANLAEFPLTWQEALDWIKAINQEGLFGYQDWRLPNRHELRSLISHQTRRPALPEQHPFQNIFHGWYWTATTAVISSKHAWYVNLDGGRMFYGGKDQSYMVWPIRGRDIDVLPVTGQKDCYDAAGNNIDCKGSGQDGELQQGVNWPIPRFESTADTVVDKLTRLSWTRVANVGGNTASWQEAFEIVKNLDGNWRLPNINELESLVDCSCHQPALPAEHPFQEVQDVYWSSTTSLFEPDWAWALYLDKGAIGVGQKKHARFHVWAVQDITDSSDN